MKFWEDKTKVGLAIATGLLGIFVLFLSVGWAISTWEARPTGAVMTSAGMGVLPQAAMANHMNMMDGSMGMAVNDPGARDGSVNQAGARDGDGEAATIYTCPMHPEVAEDHPGQCPICGMNLVEKTREGGKK